MKHYIHSVKFRCSSSLRKWIKAGSSLVLALGILQTKSTVASPCYPNDPEGTNPGNLCLTYPPSWSPLPNTSTDQAPFIQGTGKEAYYGLPISPTKPGRQIGSTSGYWTNVEAVNGSTNITDSTGKVIPAP